MNSNLVFINSYNRISGNTSNFNIDISNQINNDIKYEKISLVNISLPKTYYLINNTSNILIINENGNDYYITIQNGNYSLLSLCAYLNIPSNLSNYGVSYSYNFTPNIQTGKILITVSNNMSQDVIFKFGHDENMALILGFDEINYTFNNSLLSPNICNFELTNSISLCCDIVENQILFNFTPNVLAYNYINFQNNNIEMTSKKINKVFNNTINFYLIDNISNKNIDLNGINYAFTIILFTNDIKNIYYKLQLEDYLINTYLKKLDIEKEEYKKILDK